MAAPGVRVGAGGVGGFSWGVSSPKVSAAARQCAAGVAWERMRRAICSDSVLTPKHQQKHMLLLRQAVKWLTAYGHELSLSPVS